MSTGSARVTYRAFEDRDYPAFVVLHNNAHPDVRVTEDERRRQDRPLGERCQLRRVVAERDGQVVGVGGLQLHAVMHAPGVFYLQTIVAPELQRQGVGSRLHERLVDWARALGGRRLRYWAREDGPSCLAFLATHGFAEEHRIWTMTLDAAAATASNDGGADALRARGITLQPLSALRADVGCVARLHALECECLGDLRLLDPVAPPTLDAFAAELADPALLADASFVAVHDGEYVGETRCTWQEARRSLHVVITGVSAPYRGLGIARALKQRVVDYARAHSIARLETTNDGLNPVILVINERLGFIRSPAWILLGRPIQA